ncbi:MAG: POTRA domain-containing protein [Alphaproteobacteria bacterium]|nr:POTRA domain-containing protein [Alphaproteobacteria bacterium]
MGIFCACLSWAAAALAQTDEFHSVEPADIQERAQPKAEPPAKVDIPLPPREPVAKAEAGPAFVLTGVQITGATVYSEAELAPIYEPYLARSISLAEIEKIVTAITEKYRQDGYILSRALALPQDLDFGLLQIDVVEGFIAEVVFEGVIGGRKELLTAIADKLKGIQPLTQAALERYVMLLGDLPGLSARPALRQLDPASGAHVLVLSLDYDAFEGFASIDNKSTRTVGRHVAQLSGNFNSFMGLQERTGVYLFSVPDSARELLFGQIQHEHTLNAEGTKIGIDGWHSLIESGAHLKQFDLDSRDSRLAVYLVHPLFRGRDLSLFITGTFDYRNTDERTRSVKIYDDRIRSARLTVRNFFTDGLDGENLLIATASQGFEVLDASDNDDVTLSRTGGKVDYAKLAGSYTRWQALPGPYSAVLGLKGQVASDGVLSAEEFRAGGGNFGRAYDGSETSGDHGAAGYLELRQDLAERNRIFLSSQVFGFYDLAAAWNDTPASGTFKTSLASAGIGVRTLLPNKVRATVEVAKPLTHKVQAEGLQGDHWRFFFSLNVNF